MTNSEQILKNNQRIEALIETLKEKAVTPSGDRDENEVLYEMKALDTLRFLSGKISFNQVPTEEQYIEQQQYVKDLIYEMTGKEF